LLRAQNASDKQKTFSACSDIPRFDERNYIEQVIDKTGVLAHFTYPALENLFETAEKITWHQDEPVGSTSIYAQWDVFKLAKINGVKVMLDGQGADEQLAGYTNFLGYHLYDLFKTLQWKHCLREITATKKLYAHINPIALALNVALPECVRQPFRRLAGKPSVKPHWLDMHTLGAEEHDPFRSEKGKGSNTLGRNAYLQLMKTNLPMLLRFEDRDSMAHSVESRTPFLDFRLVEYVQALPSEFKLSQGVTKRVLRESMREILPESVRLRIDKLAFATPEELWVREHQPQKFRQAVRAAIECSRGIIKPSAEEFVEGIISGKRGFSFTVWRLVNFGMWMKTFQALAPK